MQKARSTLKSAYVQVELWAALSVMLSCQGTVLVSTVWRARTAPDVTNFCNDRVTKYQNLLNRSQRWESGAQDCCLAWHLTVPPLAKIEAFHAHGLGTWQIVCIMMNRRNDMSVDWRVEMHNANREIGLWPHASWQSSHCTKPMRLTSNWQMPRRF